MKTIIGLLFSSFVILLSAASVNAETYQLNEKQLQTLFAHGLAFSFDGRTSRLNFRFKSDGKWYADTSASDEAWGKWWIDGDRFCNSFDGPDRGWSKLREQDDCATFSIIGDNLNWSKFPKNVDLDDRSVLVRLKPEPAQPVQTATRSLDTEFVALSGGEIRALFAGGISFAWDGKDSAVIFTYRDNGKWTVAKPGGDENWGTWEIRGDQHCRSVDGPEKGWRGMWLRPTCNPVFRKGRQLFYGETHESIRPLDAATVLARIMPAEPPTVPVQTATVSSASSEALAREQAIFRQQAELERQRIEAQKRELEMMRLALEKERLQQEQLALQRQQQALQAAVPPPATAPAAPTADTAPPEITAEAALETRSESLTISGTASDDRKLTRVEVEGREVAFRGRDGGFAANVTVQIGQNRIRIAAFDAEGNKSEHIVLVTRQRDIPPVEFGRFHALVIGNNNYDTLPKLNTAVSDARAVAKILTEQYGFSVKLLENATRADISDALDEYRDRLEENDNLLIYYAGHGWLDKETSRGYWLPVGARADRRSNWYSNASLTDALQALHAKHVMVVADSCYSGTLTRSLTVPPTRNADYIARMVEKRTRVVLSSGGLEPVADSGGGEHSVFAAQFLKTLAENQGVLDGTQLFEHVRHKVVLNANQTPEYSDIRLAGHEGGDFLFVRKD